jgi:hypothetical protein
MGKLFGVLLRFVFLVGLLGLVGYNTYETAQLRREVETLRQKSSGVTVKEKAVSPVKAGSDGGSDPASLLTSARSHYDAAQEHLVRKEYAEASREMMLASQAAKKASQNAGALSGSKLREFQQAVQSLSKRAGELIDQDEGGGQQKPTN